MHNFTQNCPLSAGLPGQAGKYSGACRCFFRGWPSVNLYCYRIDCLIFFSACFWVFMNFPMLSYRQFCDFLATWSGEWEVVFLFRFLFLFVFFCSFECSFLFWVGLLSLCFMGYCICILYFLYVPGSWLYTADCDTGDLGSNPGRWNLFFHNFFFCGEEI